jgi:hypothetical protein
MTLAEPPSNPLASVTCHLRRTRAIVREFLPVGFGIPAFGVVSPALMVAALTFGTFPLALIPPPLALVAVSLALIPASLALNIFRVPRRGGLS